MTLLNNVANPNIAELALEYPGVNDYYYENQYHFEQLEASYQLADALFCKYFGLNVHLSRNHLCPRIANRLDYILWLKHILEYTCEGEIKGLDVGVGASCVYPLLGCSVTDWSFFGTDINDESLAHCRENIERNGLQHRIQVFKSRLTMYDLGLLQADSLDFTMCNPPFYDTAKEMENSKRAKALNPSTVKLVASDDELFTTGGEEALTNQMIQESLSLKTKIQWYSTMVGKKSTLERMVATLRANSVTNYAIHEVVHGSGKTRRWTIAWSFGPKRLPDTLARSSSHAIRALNPATNEMKFEHINRAIPVLEKLEDLHIVSADPITVQCTGNVWSRWYRRKKARGEPIALDSHYVFQIRHEGVIWMEGPDPKVFEAFCSMLVRECS